MRPILLVSDSERDRSAVSESLKKRRLANPVLAFPSGEKAFDYLERSSIAKDPADGLPVVVLLDLSSPRSGTMHLLQLMRFNPVFRKIPFVILSKSQEEEELMRAHDLGALAYLVKPDNPRAFVEVLESIWTTMLHLDRQRKDGKS